MTPIIPNVEGLTLAQAAPAYAAAGWFIAPTKPRDYRNPGSFLGVGWPRHTSRDVGKIERFWARHPHAGIALHTGRSGVVVADIDVDAYSGPLNHGAIQLSRCGDSQRGHRVFATAETFVSGKLPGGIGEVRSGNTVIIAAPTPHTKGGHYRWLAIGPVPNLTDAARPLFTQRQEAGAGSMSFAAFVESCIENTRPHKLQALVKLHKRALQTRNDHDAMREALKVGFGDARLGYMPAAEVIATLRNRWDRCPTEFMRLAQWAAEIAQQTDLEQLKLRSDRAKGSDSRRYSSL